ncbi:MAG: hypothetical protein IJ327_05600 [Lachnospiraceae bacterium]|nr:hypothetical protein [Lachnospiraceae bacterium]
MRKYLNQDKPELEKVFCNKCGKQLQLEQGYLKEGCFSARHVFGYFSRKDGMRHSFDLCEDCYDHMVSQFLIPVEQNEETELM